jgi:hypothetical protein
MVLLPFFKQLFLICPMIFYRTLDTPWKYFLGACGVFTLGVCNELLAGYRRQREKLLIRRYQRARVEDDLCRSLLFGFQMAIAYLLMLVAMLYESILFMTLIFGLMVGHFISLRVSASSSTPMSTGATEPLCDEKPSEQSYLNLSVTGRTPCCGGS